MIIYNKNYENVVLQYKNLEPYGSILSSVSIQLATDLYICYTITSKLDAL